jgi:aerobic carbon-monoxide dehydrogenase medium subunit
MKPAAFHYERPATVAAALDLLGQGACDTRILAGGQSLVPMMNFRLAKPERLIDINRIAGLDYIRRDGNEIVIGALARHADVKDSKLVADACPLIHAAYEWVAHGAVRNRGTLCGNLCHADPASEMPAVMLALQANLVARSKAGERKIAARDFFRGMYENALKPNEMLVEVRVPVTSAEQSHGFAEVSMRKGDFAWAAIATLVTVKGGKIERAAIAAAGIGSNTVRLKAAEDAIAGQAPSQAAFDKAGQAAYDSVNPSGDVANSAQYRRDLVRALVSRTLASACSKRA